MWTLILFVSIGMLSDKDSMALTSVEFTSEVNCKQAGQQAVSTFNKGTKDVKFICAKK